VRGCRERHTIRREGSRGCRRAWHGGVGRIASGEKSACGASCNIVCLLVGRVEQGGVVPKKWEMWGLPSRQRRRGGLSRRRGSWLAARPQIKGRRPRGAELYGERARSDGGRTRRAESASGVRTRVQVEGTGDTERRAGEAPR
jgi:hypothetical protein